MHRSDYIFVTDVKQIDMLNKEDNVLNLTWGVTESIGLKIPSNFFVVFFFPLALLREPFLSFLCRKSQQPKY